MSKQPALFSTPKANHILLIKRKQLKYFLLKITRHSLLLHWPIPLFDPITSQGCAYATVFRTGRGGAIRWSRRTSLPVWQQGYWTAVIRSCRFNPKIKYKIRDSSVDWNVTECEWEMNCLEHYVALCNIA